MREFVQVSRALGGWVTHAYARDWVPSGRAGLAGDGGRGGVPDRAIQIDVTTAPDIIAASKKASRLTREYGIPMLVLAETTARRA